MQPIWKSFFNHMFAVGGYFLGSLLCDSFREAPITAENLILPALMASVHMFIWALVKIMGKDAT